ncbi:MULTISPECIES: hypothetical protein [unclassified Brachybacterium]|uniref:hypothetical protein n=1 Tax=unclassified Brachybacterium TaxID=2623841 RepID=UPI000C8079DA|nr:MULTISPECIES: hypothetical protein [unclassified Brachybacterium]PMC74910.1 hypothetical protein CJ197_10470 [Brachybacterium sp. UMB0905]
MEQISVAGHESPVPASERAAALLRERLEAARADRGAEAAERLEQLVGERIASLLDGGAPSIDYGQMLAIVNYVELPREDEPEPTGLGKVLHDLKEKASQRGYGHIG